MKPNVYRQRGKEISQRFAKCFAAGCGGKILNEDEHEPGPWAGYLSPALWDSLQSSIKAGYDYYYGDNAYFGRGRYYRVTKNAYQHSGQGEEPDLDRLKPFYRKAKPWKKGGSKILVCTQSQGFHDRFGMPRWKEDIVERLKLFTDRPIEVREKWTKSPFLEALDDAYCVVVFSSNCAVEAIMEGVPAITLGDCPASCMSRTDVSMVERLLYPDNRMEWAGVLAANQWTLEEMRTGQCWEKVQ